MNPIFNQIFNQMFNQILNLILKPNIEPNIESIFGPNIFWTTTTTTTIEMGFDIIEINLVVIFLGLEIFGPIFLKQNQQQQ